MLQASGSAEITLHPVFDDPGRHPTVFRTVLEEMCFGENVYKYVKLNQDRAEPIMAVYILLDATDLLVSCIDLAGDTLCTVRLPAEDADDY